MGTTSQMLGKLESIFTYIAPFFLRVWPKDCPGVLFLTDPTGSVITQVNLQPGEEAFFSPVFIGSEEEQEQAAIPSAILDALLSETMVMTDEVHRGETLSWAVLPVREKNSYLYAMIGIVVLDKPEMNLSSYIRTVESMILMGYDTYIEHGTSEIVTRANRFERPVDLVKYVVRKVAEILKKGFCIAIRLDYRGCIVAQERFTSDPAGEYQYLPEVLSLLSDKRLTAVFEQKMVVHPVCHDGKPLYALILYLPKEDDSLFFDDRDYLFLQTVGQKISLPLLQAHHAEELRRDAQKKDLLYQLTKKIQATIDVDEVLQEIIASIEQLYPYFTVDLYLSVETNTTLPVKPLFFGPDEDDISNQAYMEGRLVVGTQLQDGVQITVLAAPLLGKQGIYGVLKLTTTELINLLENETSYISMLAETAGTAFENAQLYQQSRNVIRELRLINEMAQQLNRSLNLDAILQFVTKMLTETFEAEYCAILRQIDNNDTLVVLTSCKEEDKGKTVSSREQPLLDLITDKRGIILANPDVHTMPFSLVSFSSFMGVPLLQESHITGVIIVSDTKRHFFSFDDFKLLEVVAQHASLAVTNALLHSEVERMVITDNLTGLYTRRHLNNHVQHSLESDGYGSLIVLDIDHFKTINDTFGHQVGDEILIQVSNFIRRNIRDSDIAARWGGEEIAIYLPRVDEQMAFQIAERIRVCVEMETNPRVTISCGVSKWDRETHHNMSVELLFKNADIALYEAKRNGRNLVKLA